MMITRELYNAKRKAALVLVFFARYFAEHALYLRKKRSVVVVESVARMVPHRMRYRLMRYVGAHTHERTHARTRIHV